MAATRNERGFLERASDEVASWFGDRDAERRREHGQSRPRAQGLYPLGRPHPRGHQRPPDRRSLRRRHGDRGRGVRDGGHADRLRSRPASSAGAPRTSPSGSPASRHVQNNIRVRKEGTTGAGGIGQTAFGREHLGGKRNLDGVRIDPRRRRRGSSTDGHGHAAPDRRRRPDSDSRRGSVAGTGHLPSPFYVALTIYLSLTISSGSWRREVKTGTSRGMTASMV